MELNFAYILSQILTISAYILLIRTYFLKNKRRITVLSAVSMVLTACAYVCLSAWTGFAMALVAILRNSYILWQESHPSHAALTKRDYMFLVAVFIAIVLVTIPAYDGPLSLLPLFSTSIYTYSLWQKNLKIYKFCGIPVELFGTAYNVFIGSIFGTIMEAALLVATIIGFIHELKTSKTTPALQTRPISDDLDS